MSADLTAEWAGCIRCPRAGSRPRVVAGGGPAPAELMLVADAPGFHDERLGKPLAGAPGELLADLLASIGLERRDVYVTTLVKCRPPGTLSPAEDEISACRDTLEREVELVRPRVVAALGDLATRTLGGGHGVTETHGQVRRAELAGREVTLLPLYHPAAALHNARLLPALEADVLRLGELLGRTAVARAPEPVAHAPAEPMAVDEQQLGLF